MTREAVKHKIVLARVTFRWLNEKEVEYMVLL